MLNQNYTTELLNLEEVIITKVENTSDQLHIHLHLPRKEHICPCCGARTDRVHDYREQIVKDVPLRRDTFLHLRKRRYIFSSGKRFAEKNSFLPRYYRMTSRLIAEVIQAFRKVISATEIASRYNISVTTAIRYFDCVGYRCKELPEIFPLTNSRAMQEGTSTRASSPIRKTRRFWIFFPTDMKLI